MILEETNTTPTNEAGTGARAAGSESGGGGSIIDPDIGLLTNKTIFDRFSLDYNGAKQLMAGVAAVSGEMAASLEGIYNTFAIPKDVFVRSAYFQVDPDLNNEETAFITPTTSYGGWGNRNLYEISDLSTKFACAGNLKYVKPEACPHLQVIDTNNESSYISGGDLTPFKEELTTPNDTYRVYKCYWDNNHNRIVGERFTSTSKFNVSGFDSQIHKNLSEDTSSSAQISIMNNTYGCFILLAGAGGGGGGADNEYWGQGQPGGSGGGGGATALVYVDLYQLYLDYGADSCIYIKCGDGGSGGAGGADRADGYAGGQTTLYVYKTFKSLTSANLLEFVTVSGGGKGLTHYWDHAEDSAGGAGGTVTSSSSNKYAKVLTECSGGAGGAGKRGATSTAGSNVTNKLYNLPFINNSTTLNWGTRRSYSWTLPSGATSTAFIGYGTSNNNNGGGGGGCALSIIHNGNNICYGYGGKGGHNGGAGTAGGPGGYVILTSYNFNKLINVSE